MTFDNYLAVVAPRVREIPGWCPDEQGHQLYRLVLELERRGPLIVEIGSFLGKSAIVMALALQARDDHGLVVCIDPWDGSGDADSALIYRELTHPEMPLAAEFRANVAAAGVLDYVATVPMRSHEARSHWAEDGCDGLYLDGDHEYDAVRQDLDDWAPLVRPHGWLAMDDVYDPPAGGPGRAAAEFFSRSLGWERVAMCGRMLVVRRALDW